MRALVGVVVVGLVLAGLASIAVRGVRRVGWADDAGDAGRTALQSIVEGLIVLAAVILGVVVVVALVD
jgi:L-lactate permease